VFTQAKVGVALSALTDPGQQWSSLDRVNTIDVQMINGTLSNASIVDTLNLSNLALLGKELIGWMRQCLKMQTRKVPRSKSTLVIMLPSVINCPEIEATNSVRVRNRGPSDQTKSAHPELVEG
jgi:hypothetical protein